MENIFYVEQIPDLVEFISNELAKIRGMVDRAIAMRVLNNLNVYVFVGHEDAARADDDTVFPAELGIRFLDPEMNVKKYNRLWLQEFLAETRSKKRAQETYPQLAIEWMVFIRNPNGTVTLLNRR